MTLARYRRLRTVSLRAPSRGSRITSGTPPLVLSISNRAPTVHATYELVYSRTRHNTCHDFERQKSTEQSGWNIVRRIPTITRGRFGIPFYGVVLLAPTRS